MLDAIVMAAREARAENAAETMHISQQSSTSMSLKRAPVVVAVVGLAHVNSMLNLFNAPKFRKLAGAGPSWPISGFTSPPLNDGKPQDTFESFASQAKFDVVEKIDGASYRMREHRRRQT